MAYLENYWAYIMALGQKWNGHTCSAYDAFRTQIGQNLSELVKERKGSSEVGQTLGTVEKFEFYPYVGTVET